jgi:hypothetical protein
MKRLTAKVAELTHGQRQALMRQLAAIEGQTASVGVIEDRMGSMSFPLFFTFQPIGIMPPIAAHAEC